MNTSLSSRLVRLLFRASRRTTTRTRLRQQSLRLEILEDRTLLSGLVAVGADAGGGPDITVFNADTQKSIVSFSPFDKQFTGGVRVAMGDVNGDGIPDLIAAAGPGGGPNISVFDGKSLPSGTPTLLSNFFAFDPHFTGGVYIAAGDLGGTGQGDIIVGADAGGGPNVSVWHFTAVGQAPTRVFSFFPYDQNFTGGVRVASGDVQGKGYGDIITGAGPGGGPNVSVFDGKSRQEIATFFAYDQRFGAGIYVGAGDVNSDGHADIICGAGAGGGPNVTVFSGLDGSLLSSFFPYDPGFTGGVRVAGITPGQGQNEIVAAAGPGGGPDVRIFQGAVNPVQVDQFFAFDPHFTGGRYVAAGASSQSAMTGPAAPVFTAKAVSGTEIDLAWSAVSAASGYLVGELVNGAWTQIASLGSGSTGDAVPGLSPNTTYTFTVAAFNASGTTWASSQSAVTYPAAPVLTAMGTSGTQINLTWSGVAGATGYRIDYYDYVKSAWIQIDAVGGSATSSSVTKLSANTAYTFQVGALNSAGTTWSAPQNATTWIVDHPAVVPPASSIHWEVVNLPLFGASGPQYTDVCQGRLADCYFLAALAAVVSDYHPSGATFIKSQIIPLGDFLENGTLVQLYSIPFFSETGTVVRVIVDNELPENSIGQCVYAVPQGNLWVALYEKAYAQFNSDSYANISLGIGGYAVAEITGLATKNVYCSAAWQDEDVVELIRDAKAGAMITFGTLYMVGAGWVNGHSYSLIGNASSSGAYLYNPWGMEVYFDWNSILANTFYWSETVQSV